MDILLHLRQTVHRAYDTVPLYRMLYGSRPQIRSLAEFATLPLLSRRVILRCHVDLAECLSGQALGPPGILAALSPLDRRESQFPFVCVENSHDFSRRYARVCGILGHAGIRKSSRVTIICDSSNKYFASDLEDTLLQHSVILLLRDGISQADIGREVAKHEPDAIILVTRRTFPLIAIPPSCRTVITFGAKRQLSAIRSLKVFDVYTTQAVPWIGVRGRRHAFYRTNELFRRSGGGPWPQLYLETDRRNRLIVTTLADEFRSGLLPLVRFVTNDRVAWVSRSRFALQRDMR